MDEIAVRLVTWFFIDLILNIICYGVGWAVLKTLTFGQYPNKKTDENKVMFAGFISLVAVIIGITVYFYNV